MEHTEAEEAAEASANDHQTMSNMKVEVDEEASLSDGQNYMGQAKTKRQQKVPAINKSAQALPRIEECEEVSSSYSHDLMSHEKIEECEEVSSTYGHNLMSQVKIEKCEEVSRTNDHNLIRQVKIEECEEVSRTNDHNLIRQVEIDVNVEASPPFWQYFLDQVKIEGKEVTSSNNTHGWLHHGMAEGEKACTVHQQACRRRVNMGQEESYIEHPASKCHVMIKQEEDACAIEKLPCMNPVKIEEEDACAMVRATCMRQVKTELNEKSGSYCEGRMAHGSFKDKEEAPFIYVIQEPKDHVESKDGEHNERDDPLLRHIRHPPARSLAGEERHALGHLEKYMVNSETGEGKEGLVSDNTTLAVSDTLFVLEYHDFTILKYTLSLSRSQDHATQGDEDRPVSDGQDVQELLDWDRQDTADNVELESAGTTVRSHYKESDVEAQDQKLHDPKKSLESARQSSTVNINQQAHVGGLSSTCAELGMDLSSECSLTADNKNPFLCYECGQSFCDPSSFLVHQRIHPTPRPYPCPECGKRFTTKCTVIRHLQTHTRAQRKQMRRRQGNKKESGSCSKSGSPTPKDTSQSLQRTDHSSQ